MTDSVSTASPIIYTIFPLRSLSFPILTSKEAHTMYYAPQTITLKDGRSAILRSPDPERDAADLVQYLHDTAADTPFVLRTPDEVTMTVEGEERFLEAVVDS